MAITRVRADHMEAMNQKESMYIRQREQKEARLKNTQDLMARMREIEDENANIRESMGLTPGGDDMEESQVWSTVDFEDCLVENHFLDQTTRNPQSIVAPVEDD